MTIYNINKGIGWASSGVEYAQVYRAGILRELGLPMKFIFTDFFQQENIAHFTANLGFEDQEIIWLYGFFTDLKIAPTTFTVEEFEQTLPPTVEQTEKTEFLIRYKDEQKQLLVTAYLRKNHPEFVQRVEYASKNKLIRKDYYSYTKVMTEYYAPKDNKAYVYQRDFYNEDGSVAYVENSDGQQKFYRVGKDIIDSQEELLGLMLRKLNLTNQDLLLLDRATDIGQAVFRHKGAAKLAVVVHAEHYSVKSSTNDHILWNNFYEYQFTNAQYVDAFISSTEEQSKTLGEQFAHYQGWVPKIVTIPVGALEGLRGQEHQRKPYSLISCSRLAKEKHLDWLVKAVALAKEDLPGLTFDIYGAGSQEKILRDLIAELGAEHYIRLMGHHDLTEVYQDYEIYLTASTSEGFGLTLMEAVGSGLPIIGLDVPYGNQTFVRHQENGQLLPRLEVDDREVYAQGYAQVLVNLYQTRDLAELRARSYERASDFLKENVKEQWRVFIEEVTG